MNCPYCGKEMERGIIPQERNGCFYWLPYSNFDFFFATRKNIKKAGGIIIKEPLTDGYMFADVCRSCGKGIFTVPREGSGNA